MTMKAQAPRKLVAMITADYCILTSGWNDGSANQTTSLDVYTTLSRDVIG